MSDYTLSELQGKVIEWAAERNILEGSNPIKQLDKLYEEFLELQSGVHFNDLEAIKDGIGDMMVVLIIIAAQKGLTVKECLNHAWDEIKDRKGKIVDGLFCKEV